MQGSKSARPTRRPVRTIGSSVSEPQRGQIDRRRRGQFRDERAQAHAHPRLAQDVLQRLDVLQVERVARVILGHEQHAARIGTDALDRRLDRLHAQRQERRIEVVEAAGKEIRVDRRELEAGVAQVDGRIERHRVLLPLRAYPALDIGHPVEDALLEVQQRSGKRSGEMGNHGGSENGRGSIVAEPPSPQERADQARRWCGTAPKNRGAAWAPRKPPRRCRCG